MLEISTVGIRAVPKRTPLEKSRRELSEDVSFGIGTIGTVGTLLVVEQSSLETTPGGVIYIIYIYTAVYHTTVVYGIQVSEGLTRVVFAA